jgi:U6 snRNA m6A methyltransferase
MVGHKKNAFAIMQELELSGAVNISKTEFCQGNTTRWGIAWTFSPETILPSTKLQVHSN